MRTQLVERLVAANNRLVRRVDGDAPNPRPVDDEPWAHRLREDHAVIQAEWEAFVAAGYRLPLIEDVLDGPQGNVGSSWCHGPLIARRRPLPPLADHFPATVAAFLAVPDLLSASWSVFAPGAELPPHTGDNAGALNFLYGVDCPSGAGHEIEGREFRLDRGETVIFDDTRPHRAWNRGDRPRILIIGDVMRPVGGLAGLANAGVQFARHHLTPGYHRVEATSAELHRALNG